MSSPKILQRYRTLKYRTNTSVPFRQWFYFQQRTTPESNQSTKADVPQTFYDAQKQPYQSPTELRKLQRPPFLKDLFLGKFNTDMLTYPEALDKTHLEILEKRVESLQAHLTNYELEATDHSKHALNLTYLKRSGFLGVQVPVEYGGLDLSATEYVRIQEAMATNPHLTLSSLAHGALGVKGILLHGNEEQKSKYLAKLVNGELLATFCLQEETSGRDALLTKTTAKLSEDGASYIINGTKAFVPNGKTADLYIVLVKLCEEKNVNDEYIEQIDAVPAVFMIHREAGGITFEPCTNTKGLNELNMCTVRFENTIVPKENMLGEKGKGFQVSSNVISSSRLGFGAITARILRQLLDRTVNHAINTVQYSKPLMEMDMIKEKIAMITCSVYAMESMSFLTAGVFDGNTEPDYYLEAAAETIYSVETGLQCIEDCYRILDERILIHDMSYDQYLRQLAEVCSLEGSTDVLRMYISLVGESHVGKEKASEIRKIRNSIMFPNFVIKKRLKEEWRMLTKLKTDLDLQGYLHPSLCQPAEVLEECLELLGYSAELILRQRGKEAPLYQMELRRVADMAVHMYMMTAVLGRASRSYCIGLQNADTELLMASCLAQRSAELIRKWAEELRQGPYVSTDESYKKIASCMFKFKSYSAEHPLARNW